MTIHNRGHQIKSMDIVPLFINTVKTKSTLRASLFLRYLILLQLVIITSLTTGGSIAC